MDLVRCAQHEGTSELVKNNLLQLNYFLLLRSAAFELNKMATASSSHMWVLWAGCVPPCTGCRQVLQRLRRHLQVGTLLASDLHGFFASCLSQNTTHTLLVNQKPLTNGWQHTHQAAPSGKKADNYWDASGKRPGWSVGRQRQGSEAVGRKWSKSREALWLFLPSVSC